LKNARVCGVRELAEAASAHYVSGGGLVGTRRTHARHREVHVVEEVEELGSELKIHSLVDRQLFDSCHIDIEETRIRQQVLGALKATSGRIAGKGGAAERLGLKRTTLQNKMQKLGITRASL